MRLNSATFNGRRFNIGPTIYPVSFQADSIGIVASALDATRYANATGIAVTELRADLLASALRYLSGGLLTTLDSELLASALRIGSGTAVVNCDGSLYHARLIYGSGAAEIRIIALSDIGVVYGEGAGVMTPYAELGGARMRHGEGVAITVTGGLMTASAIRVPATGEMDDFGLLLSELDSATITAGGVRYINGFGGAYAYLELEDAGMVRQVFIGSVDLEILATGSAAARRHGSGEAKILTFASGGFQAIRTAESSSITAFDSSMSGDILAQANGTAVISFLSSLTGYVFRRGGVLNAISTLAAQVDMVGVRNGEGSASVITVMDVTPNTRKIASGIAVVELSAESTGTDVDFAGMDDDTERFYRPPMQRDFARPAMQREWRRL